jgi:hypothetical protein
LLLSEEPFFGLYQKRSSPWALEFAHGGG